MAGLQVDVKSIASLRGRDQLDQIRAAMPNGFVGEWRA
jgi:hypothetical protein